MRRSLAIAACSVATGCGFLQDDPALQTDRAVGASAHDLLSDERFRSLVVELQSVQGQEPTPEAQSALLDFLEQHLNKPDGIRVVVDPPLPIPGKQLYSVNDVKSLENGNRRDYPADPTLVVYVLALDGSSTSDHDQYKTLGVSYRNTSIVLYEGTVRKLSGQSGQPSLPVLEATVLLHEVGHILGLVDSGSPMMGEHGDAEHHGHCTNPQCLMYYTVHSNPSQNILGGGIPRLDADCLADLKANGGK